MVFLINTYFNKMKQQYWSFIMLFYSPVAFWGGSSLNGMVV